jgi:hypothetical protein
MMNSIRLLPSLPSFEHYLCATFTCSLDLESSLSPIRMVTLQEAGRSRPFWARTRPRSR